MTAHSTVGTAVPILTFDIGGTSLRAALYVAATGELRSSARRQSPSIATTTDLGVDRLWDRLGAQMLDLADEVLGGVAPAAVAVAFPAPLDHDGNAIASPTLFGEQGYGFPIRRAVQSLWPESRVVVLNDLSAAGYRYVDRWRDFCIVTVGSGIGHKIFLDGKPQVGRHGRGGECGHLVVSDAPDAPLCDCGGRGHLGAMASGRGTVRLAQWRASNDLPRFAASTIGQACGGRPDRLNTYNLVAGFRNGDGWVDAIVTEAAGLLGRTLAGMHLAVGIETFILVGGFALGLGEGYRVRVTEGAGASCWQIGQSWNDMIRLGEPDDDHGMIGAGLQAARLVGCRPAVLAGSLRA